LFEHDYPFAWLGILAAVAPSTKELIYANHERGFALHSLRSPEISRFYLQVPPDEDVADWPDDRVWEELSVRLAAPGWSLTPGQVLDKTVAQMRTFVAEPMRYERLVLAGDASHIVPATGAKGLNLAVNDVRVLSEALAHWFRTGATELLERYSDRVLRRVWRAEHFSHWMSAMLHRYPGDDPFRDRLQRSQLEYVCSSGAAATSLAENYVGLPFDAEPGT
jgi:p-hydroxybenzoate 3-monooxygenase